METMGMEMAQALLRDLRRRGFASAIFGGGEPFAWPHDLKKILAYAKSLGLATQVGTNGICFPASLARWDFVDRWVIPLDGASPGAHNRMRAYRERHWQIATGVLGKLRAAGRSATVSTVVTRVNRDEIVGIGEYLRALQDPERPFLHAWHLYKFLPFGRGGEAHRDELLLADAEYERIFSEARQLALPFRVFKRENMLLSKTVEFYWLEGGRLRAQSRANGIGLAQLGARPA
jgi:MoaA/NifB/PqqE/SkfB family radical SAM enzyme